MNEKDSQQHAAALSDDDAARLAEVMQGLASPVRLKILDALSRQPTAVGELSTMIDENQTTVSNHLRLLRHLSLVKGTRQGRHILYSIYDGHVGDLLEEAIGHVRHIAG